MLDEALGDLADSVELVAFNDDGPTASPIDTPLWDALNRVTPRLLPGAACSCRSSPSAPPTPGSSAAPASTAYGFGLFSEHMTFEDYGAMFHGDNERVDQESLRLSTEMWHAARRRLPRR